MLNTKPFKGANVFMSRNLVPPEVFDALLDALKLNGADVFLCCDPSRHGLNDFHIISSSDHEKFEDLRAKGCNLLGPHCVLSCAKEHRPLPKQGFTCCLAMDGVKVLASGFDMDEKVKIEQLVTAMSGVLQTKASVDVRFVVVKNVSAAKYKWALNVLKKPVVTINWLYQCWNEHRVVPQESYRVLPFSGLTICVTRIPADKRKEIEKLIIQNDGKYSAELTKKCTHLISDISFSWFLYKTVDFDTVCILLTLNLTLQQFCIRGCKISCIFLNLQNIHAPEGDKYKVARRWGHIRIVTTKWFDQSVASKACLNEESYPVQGGFLSSSKTVRDPLIEQHSQDKCMGNSHSVPSSVAAESNLPATPCARSSDPDLEATLSQNMSSMFSDLPVFLKEVDCDKPTVKATTETNLDGCVADDSQSEESDLHLSECRISLVGFEAPELRKLVNMVRRGGGSRYMSFNDKLTHIVVGAPTEVEKKELRGLAASGVINVVRTAWLEDCDREKKEMPVLCQHIAYDLLLPKDSVSSLKGAMAGMAGNQARGSIVHPSIHSGQLLGGNNSDHSMPSLLEENRDVKAEMNINSSISLEGTVRRSQQNVFPVVNDPKKGSKRMQNDCSDQNVQRRKSLDVFKGKTFCFSKCFPEDRRSEIVQWVNQGGGELVLDKAKQKVHFTIECHGVKSRLADDAHTLYVSSHWVRSCLEGGCLLDVGSHVIYSPLPCRIPLPGFENFRFCISQYEEKDRLLLRNLCFVLGAKFVEKLTRKVTHLLCKFTSGPKYEAACKWDICSITSEWIYECVRQNEVVALDQFRPKEITSQDQELCTVSQFPTQAVQMISGENASQFISQPQDLRKSSAQIGGIAINSFMEEAQQSIDIRKKAKIFKDNDQKSLLSFKVHLSDSTCNMNSTEGDNTEDNGESSHDIPDVAAAIEDLLEQTSKIHDQKSPGRTGCDKSLFSSDCSMLGEGHEGSPSVIGLPKHWLSRTGRREESNTSEIVNDGGGLYDGFSETQTESQVVGYEEDLTGRQMLIDRVRTRSSMT
ncbi:unnamed protein product [Dovyalis caffra]|uniref:BRCT domain-containing protein n=1 Tax=Dovyalis caffra TaxID=77055 RepID=A0AAV1S657_9ROSI|nr:unnamed protein product [Dovyalis caffra]